MPHVSVFSCLILTYDNVQDNMKFTTQNYKTK